MERPKFRPSCIVKIALAALATGAAMPAPTRADGAASHQKSATTTAPATIAATAPTTGPRVEGPEVVALTLRPSSAALSVGRYALLPPLAAQTPGDAVPLYLLARSFWPDQKTNNEVLYPENEKYDYLGTPAGEFPPKYADRILETFGHTLDTVDAAARRSDARWDLNWRERQRAGHRPYAYLDDLHHVTNILHFIAGYRVAQGDWPAAERAIQTSLGMARHLGTAPDLVHALCRRNYVDNAIYGGVEPWIGRGRSPNLYWALTDLPQPFVELGSVSQMWNADRAFYGPQIARAVAGDLPPEQWPATLREMVRLPDRSSPPARGDEALDAETSRLTAATLGRAKAGLLAAGLGKAQVEAMSPAQAVGTYFCRESAAANEQQWKGFALPYPQAREQMDRAWQRLAPDKQPASDNPLIQAELVIENNDYGPNGELLATRRRYGYSRIAEMRFQFEVLNRRIAILRTVEALRDYAAGHDGHPPERLDQLTELPVPPDPMTGQPFLYRLEGRRAVIDAPPPPGHRPRAGRRYELTFVQ